MRRRVKVAVFLASGAVLLLVIALLAAPRLRARAIEASLPPDPGLVAMENDWVAYRMNRVFTNRNRTVTTYAYVCGGRERGVVFYAVSPTRDTVVGGLSRRSLESRLEGLFPGSGAFRSSFDVSDETRVLRGRSFVCTRVTAYLGDGDMKRAVTYWLSSEVKLMGYVAKSIVYLNGNSEEEEVVGFGNGDGIDWGERP